jgi:penicillin-binding protein 1A
VKTKLIVLLTPAVWSAVVACVTGALLGWGAGRALHVPQLDRLKSYHPVAGSRVIGADASQVALFATKRRIELDPDQIPNHLKLAIVAGEHASFYTDGPVSPKAILRAVIGSVTTLRIGGRGGGSTITQQLALNLFLKREKTLKRKLREALLAIDLEKRLSKDQILTMYANIIYFGRGTWGVEAASQLYFDCSAVDLDLSKAALLAAIIPSPENKFSPSKNPDKALDRRNRILKRMLELGFIDADACQAALDEPLGVFLNRDINRNGAYFIEQIRQRLTSEYGHSTTYTGGLEVRVTMDPELQRAAERALREGLVALDMRLGWRRPKNVLEDRLAKSIEEYEDTSWYRYPARPEPGSMIRGVVTEVSANRARLTIGEYSARLERREIAWTGAATLQHILRPGDLVLLRLPEVLPDDPEQEIRVGLLQEPQLEGALLAIENQTGAVLAMVGGFDFQRSEFNRAVQSVLQCGSAFKPFVALSAFEQGFTPADTLLDAPFLLADEGGEQTYCPKNFHPTYYGVTTLRRAVEMSYNASAVKLQEIVEREVVIDTARRFGISTELEPFASLALGSMGVRLIEMVRAYAAIANLGELPEPYLIESVHNRDGKELAHSYPTMERAMSAPVAYLMLHVLRGVVENGTARSLAELDVPLAGKTGTTDEYTDAWFVGFSPRITVGVWVGRDRHEPIGSRMSGSVAALPIWKQFIESYIETLPEEQRSETFPIPAGVVFVPVDRMTGRRATPDCEDVVLEAFLTGTEPVVECGEELHLLADLPWPFQLPSYTPHAREPLPTEDAIRVADQRLARDLGITLD